MEPAPPLLPLLRSQVQAELLTLTYLHPEAEYTLTEAAGQIGASVRAVHAEAERLIAAGFLLDRRHGNNRLVRAATDTPLAGPLTELLAVSFGPRPVLTELLAGLPGVDEAYLYGSWAARYSGEPGPIPTDVDVLVVGTADPDDLDDVARAAQTRLGREVNVHRVRPTSWRAALAGESDDPFFAAVLSRPRLPLSINGSPASRAAS